MIPEMTHPLGKYWDQPKLSEITFQKERVLMKKESIEKLKNYSHSIPSGAYEGKMWRTKRGDRWLLCWYGSHPEPDTVSINRIPIKEVW